MHRADVELVERIGEGALGAVYRGTFRGSEVAVKKALRSMDESQHAELRKDAEGMQAIPGHPNILQFFGACFDAGGVLLVVELCDAGSLEHYLAKQPALDAATRLALCEQVAAGMSHLEHLSRGAPRPGGAQRAAQASVRQSQRGGAGRQGG